jgi:hypothetical protein
LFAIKKKVMNTRKLSIAIGILLAVAFAASLIAALSSEEEYENKLKPSAEKEYNCPASHACDHSKEGHKSCCNPDKCREMKCDPSTCAHQDEKCAMAEKKCDPSECPHHADKCVKGEMKYQPATCVKHADKSAEGEKKCDPAKCTGKCPLKTAAGK